MRIWSPMVLLLIPSCAPPQVDRASRDRAVWQAVVDGACHDVNPCARAIVEAWNGRDSVGRKGGYASEDSPFVLAARQLQRDYQLEDSQLTRLLQGCRDSVVCSAPLPRPDTIAVPAKPSDTFCSWTLTLSRITYSTDGRTALVPADLSCASLGGQTSIVLARRSADGAWHVLKVALVTMQ
jgi:hypothetical protein